MTTNGVVLGLASILAGVWARRSLCSSETAARNWLAVFRQANANIDVEADAETEASARAFFSRQIKRRLWLADGVLCVGVLILLATCLMQQYPVASAYLWCGVVFLLFAIVCSALVDAFAMYRFRVHFEHHFYVKKTFEALREALEKEEKQNKNHE